MWNRRRQRLTKEKFLMLFGAFLIIGAFVWAIYNQWEDHQAQQRSEELLKKVEVAFAAKTRETSVHSAGTETVQSEKFAETATEKQVADSPETKTARQSTALEKDVFAILEIPSLDLRLPVLNRYSQKNLKQYVCRYGTEFCEDGQFVIAGHNYKSHFKRLSDLAVGERVLLIFPGREQEYAVSERVEIDGDDRKGLFSGEWDLSLFTCDFSGERRVVVRCVDI